VKLSLRYAIGRDGSTLVLPRQSKPISTWNNWRLYNCTCQLLDRHTTSSAVKAPIISWSKGTGCSPADLETATAWFGQEQAWRCFCWVGNSD
jgi:hypothetical protein